MTLHISKVTKNNKGIRINIPRSVLEVKKWIGVAYVIIDDQFEDNLLIRKFIDEESLRNNK